MKRLIAFIALVGLLFTVGVISGFGSQAASHITDSKLIQNLAAVAIVAFILLKVEKPSFDNSVKNAFTEGICPRIQLALIDVLGDGSPQYKRTQVGFTQALMSPTNTAGMKVIPIDPGTGKKKSVRLVAVKRGLESDVVTTKAENCETQIEPEPYEQDVDITAYVGSPGIKFSEKEMRKLCQADSAYIAEVMQAHIDPVVRKLNRLLLTDQSVNFGNFADGTSTVHDVALLQDNATKTPIYFGESEVMQYLDDISADGRPLVIGSNDLIHYANMTDKGCCNLDGLDLSQAGQWEVYKDKMTQSILGAEHFAVLAPGYTQLLTYNEYVGDYAKSNDVFTHGTMVDPISGLKFDLRINYTPCNDTYFMQFGLWYKLYRIPADAFAVGDPLAGVNYTLHFRSVRSTY